MNLKAISRNVGYALLVSALFMFLSIVVSILNGRDSALAALIISFLITAIVTVIMILVSSIFPKFFLSIGRGLLIGLIASIVIEVLGMLIFKWSMNFMDYIVALIFCGFIGLDWARAQVFPKTLDNAVDSAADIYVDVANLFIRILAITGKSSD